MTDIRRSLIFATKRNWHLTLLFLLPLSIAIIDKNWFFVDPSKGWTDLWMNVGFFLHYTDPTYIGYSSYKISRLSWIIPGYLVYKLFSPIVASLLLHLGSIVITSVFLYLTLSKLISREIAFVVSLFLEVYIPILGSGGWDYQNTPAGVYYIMTLYFLTRAAQSPKPFFCLFLSGIAFAATLSSVIQFVNLIPIIVYWYFSLDSRKRSWKGAIISYGVISIGSVFLIIILGIINWLVGRQFLFFKPMLELVFSFVKTPDHQKPWWAPWSSGWLTHALDQSLYLFLPLTILLVCLLYLGVRPIRSRNAEKINSVFIIQYVFISFLWILWQSLGQTALQPSYFAYPLYIPMLIAIAGLVNDSLASEIIIVNEKLPIKHLIMDALIVIFALTTVLYWQFPISEKIASKVGFIFQNNTFIFIGIITSMLLTIRFMFYRLQTATLFVVLFLYLLIQGGMMQVEGSNIEGISSGRCADSQKLFLAMIDIDHSVYKFSSEQTTGILWDPEIKIKSTQIESNCSLPLDSLGNGLTAWVGHWFGLHPWDNGYLRINDDPNKIPKKYFISPFNRVIGVIYTDPSYLKSVIKRFNKFGMLHMRIVEHITLVSSYYRFNFDVLVNGADPLPTKIPNN